MEPELLENSTTKMVEEYAKELNLNLRVRIYGNSINYEYILYNEKGEPIYVTMNLDALGCYIDMIKLSGDFPPKINGRCIL